MVDQIQGRGKRSSEKLVATPDPGYIAETTTPSGIEIRYSVDPKRKYEVRLKPFAVPETGEMVDGWQEVPSVTTVLDVLHKPLQWWGMEIGIDGTLAYYDTGMELPRTVDKVVEWMTVNKLTVNHVRDKAAQRGTSVHDAFEVWCRTGFKPDRTMFLEEDRGYIDGLNQFIEDVQPEPLMAEVMVGSVQHGFAGRYDVRFQTSQERQVVYKRTPVKGAWYATLAPGLFLADLKTSSGIYPSHSRQLEAYEGASVECGYEPTDARGIIHVTKDGNYSFVRSTATFEDFLCVLDVWRSEKTMAKRKKDHAS